GNEVSVGMSLITAFIVPLFNVLAVVNFTYYDPEYDKINYWEMVKGTIRNPLIIGILLALLFNYLNLKVPVTINNTLYMIRGIAVPMALINIGSMFSLKTGVNDRRPLFLAVLLKVVLYPMVFTAVAILFGYRGSSLGIIFVLLASPTATTSFIMAKAMKSNETLAAAIVVFSTAASFFTIFIGISLLKALGFF
ncbi:MAG: AEC family transporter, partial [Eubacteriales bacterium]|nr:AEC family transporter [Eubacteriales bacterium]